MRILITGGSGFIGRALIDVALKHGHHVVVLSRSKIDGMPSLEWCRWDLGDWEAQGIPSQIDMALHLAHDFGGQKGAEETINGTLGLANRLAEHGCPRQIFFSSYSAGEHATSVYGTTKTIIERGFMKLPGGIVVRPGLVIGDGGVYRKIQSAAIHLPVIPLPGGGRGKVPVIKIEKLCERIMAIAERNVTLREINLFESEVISLRDLVDDAARMGGKKLLILPIPDSLLLFGLGLAKLLHIPLPINEDNLRGFMSNQLAQHSATAEEFFGK